MNRDKQIEEMAFTDVDILANDINQHCADLAQTYCGDTNCLTCLAHALTEKGYRKASDVASEIFEEIYALFRKHFEVNRYLRHDFEVEKTLKQSARFAINELWHDVSELKKKYTEDGK